GGLVCDAGAPAILSNNHVLADEGRLEAGAPIFQPGLLDHGNRNTDQIAALTTFVPLQAAGFNKVDCAIARATDPALVTREILYIGAPGGTAPAQLDMVWHQFGRATSYIAGRVTSVDLA